MIVPRDVIVRRDHPTEPGAWIEIRRLAWREFPKLTGGPDALASLFEKAVVAWSEPEPVSPEAIDRLSDDTAQWLLTIINEHNHPTVTETDRKNAPSPITAT